jgi:hypothetical protein
VNGKVPGEEIRLESAGEVTVHGSVVTQTPLDRVELIMNGKTVHPEPAEGKTTIEFQTRVPLRDSSWIALRALGPRHRLILNDTMAFAHTSAVYITVGGRQQRIAEDIRFYREWVERLIARTEKSPRFANDEHRKEVVTLFQKALAWYRAAEKQ